MKRIENILEYAVDAHVNRHSIAEKMDDLRTFLKVYLNELHVKHDIPPRRDTSHHEKVMKLEENPETWGDAQEIWNASWILDEVRNIESSLKQIETCLEEKQKLEQERLV